ncbi:hypothetical protein [Planctomicrobium sp. SH527]|uniref:hypothetical protein n=1 Tax=Planctomicrobium sp. SH527 TaxID=3448123 RepID=UPI003F5CACBF
MTEENDVAQRFVPRIREELDKLPLTESQKQAALPSILSNVRFLDTGNNKYSSDNLPSDSGFFDFASKLQEVATHFENDGLTLPQYLQAALKQPQLFHQSPATIAGNIEGLVDRFTKEGLTTRQYLQAAIKQPSLFSRTPTSVAHNIEGVAARFAAEGLTTQRYLQAALKAPSLFTQSPATIADNIMATVDRFTSEGLTTSQYLQAALKQPQLFYLAPATVAGNITGVVDHFAPEGLTTRRYLQAALKQTSLFTQKPATIAGHIGIVFDLVNRGIFQPPGLRQSNSGAPHNNPHAAALDFLLNNPKLLSLADDNFRLREIHQRLANGPSNSRLLISARHFVERDLSRHLGHNDLAQPVPSDGFAAGMASPTEQQAKRFLLRALMHAGYIKGGSMER